MTFEIDVAGRTRSVSIERGRHAGEFRVTVDGRTHVVEARAAGDGALLLTAGTFPEKVPTTLPAEVPGTDSAQVLGTDSAKVPGTEADNWHTDGTLAPRAGAPRPEKVPATCPEKVPATWEVFLAPTGVPGELLATIGGRAAVVTVNGRRTGRHADAGRHTHGEQSVVAPMPGRVVRVLVSPGDEVAARQGVVVVEAMKMENELRAPKKGRVKDVSVAAGTSVEAGRVLIVIE